MSIKLQDCHERTLRHLHSTYLAHSLLTLLLLLEQLALTGDVTAVALGRHILAYSLDRLPGDYFRAYGRLDSYVELLPRDKLLQFLADFPAEIIRMVLVYQAGERVGRLSVQEDIQLHQLRRTETDDMIVE